MAIAFGNTRLGLTLLIASIGLVACGGDSDDPATASVAPPPPANNAPTISGSPPTSVTAGIQYSFTPSASDADGDSLTFSVLNPPAWATFTDATGRLRGTPGAGNVGTYNDIVISVSDGKTTTALPAFSVTVNNTPPPANTPPTISGTPSTSVMQDQPYAFTPTANDANGDALSFTASGVPGWASFNGSTGRLSGTPDAADVGVYANIIISVTDGQATRSLPAFAITVVATATGSVTLSWTAPTQNTDGSPLTDLAGYRIYWGTSQSNLTNSVTLTNPGVTTYVVGQLTPATWYFAATARNNAGLESAFSNIATRTITP
jgi:hypothetical protein